MTVIHARTLQRTLPDGHVLVAHAVLDHHAGNQRPSFSLTGEEWEMQAHLNRHRQTGSEKGLCSAGAMGDALAASMPELEIINRLHLADDDGVPLHAAANGWYWYADYDGRGTGLYPHNEPWYSLTPHERAAKYLRVNPAVLPADMGKEAFYAYVETLRPDWKKEADAAVAWLQAGS